MRQRNIQTLHMCYRDWCTESSKQCGKHFMDTQHMSVRRREGAYTTRERERERECEGQRERGTTKIVAMGWALKHETSKHIDTSHVSHVLQRWGTEASKQCGKHLMNTHHFSEGWSLQHQTRKNDEHTAPVCQEEGGSLQHSTKIKKNGEGH